MTYQNVRFLWYYGMCLNCGAGSVRSVVPRGEVLPCDKCAIGFRMVLGRRALWDNENGQRREKFQSAVVSKVPDGEPPTLELVEADDNATDSAAAPGMPHDTELSEAELRWLFGYGGTMDGPGL